MGAVRLQEGVDVGGEVPLRLGDGDEPEAGVRRPAGRIVRRRGEHALPDGEQERLDRAPLRLRPGSPDRVRELAQEHPPDEVIERLGRRQFEQAGEEMAEVDVVAPGGERARRVAAEVVGVERA